MISRKRSSVQKALAEAQVIIANNHLKQAAPPAVDTPVADAPVESKSESESTKNVLTTQWLSVISIFVSLAGIYYKREEIKSLLTKKTPQNNTPPPAPPNSPVDFAPKRKGFIQNMD